MLRGFIRKIEIVGVAVAALGLGSGVAWAAPFTLTNGPGDGTVEVGVDGYGSFGSSVGENATDAFYDPVGAVAAAGTAFESGVAIRFGDSGARQFLTSGDIGGSGGLANPTVTGTPTSAASTFTVDGLSFSLTQTLTSLFDTSAQQNGSLLTQTYSITNTTASDLSFELIRYIDGDLQFDASIVDGGGRFFSDGREFLFETDSATGALDPTTLVAITGEGGTIPASGRYEINSYTGLRDRIIAGDLLADVVAGDGPDSDQFIDTDNGYDVTLALRNNFTLGANASTIYTTSTLFGTGAPQDLPPPIDPPPPTTVPEPSGIGMLCVGAIAVFGVARRRRRLA